MIMPMVFRYFRSQKGISTTALIILITSILCIAFFGVLVYSAKQKKQERIAQGATQVQIKDTGWVRGNPDAGVIITEFSDLQCPACAIHEGNVQKILAEFEGKVALRYKHFPLTGHKYAVIAARAAEAAGKQEKFWEMHDLLFVKQQELSDSSDPKEKLTAYAKQLELDVDAFTKDLDSKELETIINQQRDEGINIGVNSTPTFFINGKLMNTPDTYESFKAAVETELGKVIPKSNPSQIPSVSPTVGQ